MIEIIDISKNDISSNSENFTIYKNQTNIKVRDSMYSAYDNYLKLMNCSVQLFKKNLKNILNSNYIEKKQDLSKGKYYKRSSVNYGKINKLNMKKDSLKLHNKIRALIFPPYQIPVVNGIILILAVYFHVIFKKE